MVFGQATNNGGGKSFIVVGQANNNGGEAHRSNNGGDFLVPDYYKEYRGSICINLCKKLVSLITIVISFNSFIKFLL